MLKLFSSIFPASHLLGSLNLQPMYDFLKVLNITQLFHLEYAKFLYRFHSNLLPIPIGGYFLADPYVNRHRYGLRSRTTNQPTRLVRKTRFADNSIQVKGPKIWEEITKIFFSHKILHRIFLLLCPYLLMSISFNKLE